MNIYVRDLRAPNSALCVFDQEVLCTVLMQAGRQPGSLGASRKLQQRGRGPDGAVGWLRQKSCQTKKERPLPVQDWGSEWKKAYFADV